jgi:gluconate 2-dehydrogenase gamma chain
MMELSRRELLTLLGLTAAAAACDGAERATGGAPGTPASGGADSIGVPKSAAAIGAPEFFTAHEMATVTLLADLIIPRDERSGSASDAGAPAYIDYALREVESERTRVAVRGGLAWLDNECRRRFTKQFVDCAPEQRTAVLDDVAWPRRARPEHQPGAAFFSAFRDLVATAFWSSPMGVKDLAYQGNVFVADWKGCPPEALQKLGVAYPPEV